MHRKNMNVKVPLSTKQYSLISLTATGISVLTLLKSYLSLCHNFLKNDFRNDSKNDSS